MEKVKNALRFLRRNWYAALCTATLLALAFEFVDTWAGFGVPFTAGFISLIVYNIKNS